MEHKIYYHDTDSGGVVYYANYLKYLEEARTEYLELRGESVGRFIERGFFFGVRSCNIVYKAPARYGDVIVSDAAVEKITGAQIFFRQSVKNRASGQVLVEADVVLVCLNMEFKPQAIPSDLKERFQ